MFSKEEDLQKIDIAYERIVISPQKFETKEFSDIVNDESIESLHIGIYEFLENFEGDSLFVNFESLLKHFGVKQALHILLQGMEDADKSFFILYLYVPSGQENDVKKCFEEVYHYQQEWISELYDKYDDEDYVIRIDDNRNFRTYDYFTIYPDGKVYLFIDSDFEIIKKEFYLDAPLKNELLESLQKNINRIIEELSQYLFDDREFSKLFKISYGLKWLDISSEQWTRNIDYFLEEYPSKTIKKIMNLPMIKELFVNKKPLQ